MRKYMLFAIIIIVFLFPVFVLGQEKTTATPDDEWVEKIHSYYGVIYGSGEHAKPFVDTRIGGGVAIRLSEYWTAEMFSVFFSDQNWSEKSYINGFGLTYKADAFRLDIGKIATPTTVFHRPVPYSFAGQFEGKAQLLMPGGAYGIRVQRGAWIFGVSERNDGVEVHAGWESKWMKISAWTGPSTNGLAFTTTTPGLFTVSAWTQGIVANTVMADCITTGMLVFSSTGYNYELGQWVKAEFGLYYETRVCGTNMFGAVSYNSMTPTPMLYFGFNF